MPKTADIDTMVTPSVFLVNPLFFSVNPIIFVKFYVVNGQIKKFFVKLRPSVSFGIDTEYIKCYNMLYVIKWRDER